MTDALKTWLPLALSTATALFAIWIGQRARKSDARRTFVEFALKQRAEVAAELLAAMTLRIQLLHEAAYWRSMAVSDDPKLQQLGRSKMLETIGAPFDKSTTRMNDAWSAAHVVFSVGVLKPGEALVTMCNETAMDPGKFDKGQASDALAALSRALRIELRIEEVIKYQDELFGKK